MLNWTSRIAAKYLFSKKKKNFINIITAITAFGLVIGTTSLLLVLSVFNGLQELITGMINQFNPMIKVQPVEGKYFHLSNDTLLELSDVEGIENIAFALEEIALFEYDEVNSFGRVKGVSDNYEAVSGLDSALIDGAFDLGGEEFAGAIIGSGIARNLYIDVYNPFAALSIFTVDLAAQNTMMPVKEMIAKPSGIFSIQQDIDNEYVFVPLDFAQSLLNQPNQYTALEINVTNPSSVKRAKQAIKKVLGPRYEVLDRFEQDADARKIMNIEKWMAFAISSLMILLIAFNLVGCLWMIVLDKKDDIAILKAIGGNRKRIRRIFLKVGLAITLISTVAGLAIAIGIYYLQDNFGLIRMSEGFVVENYPIDLNIFDIVVVSLTVMLIGFVASVPAAVRAGLFDKIRHTN